MRKAFAGAALLAALTLALAACGGNDNGGAGTAATEAPTTTAAQAASGATVAVADGKLGDILVDGDGRTLYAFTKDKGDQSACSGQCATNWPALTGTATAGTGVQASLLSTSMQANGDTQVTPSPATPTARAWGTCGSFSQRTASWSRRKRPAAAIPDPAAMRVGPSRSPSSTDGPAGVESWR
jgi:predicted lipoprotein with Yx(FWY)xxD motif